LGFQDVAIGGINRVAALTKFSYKKMYDRFTGTKKSGRSNEVTVRQGPTVYDKDRRFGVIMTPLTTTIVIVHYCFPTETIKTGKKMKWQQSSKSSKL